MTILPAQRRRELAVPVGNVLQAAWHAEGTRRYRAEIGITGKLAWAPAGTDADLLPGDAVLPKQQVKPLGHTDGTTWSATDGSSVAGAVVKSVPAADALAAPWQLLRALKAGGGGVLDKVTFIQLVDTDGGLPPAKPPIKAGEEASTAFRANYLFYRAR
jgi:hypothetical protein